MMHFSNRRILIRYFKHIYKTQACDFTSKSNFLVECLKQRTLLKLSGSETNSYLQSMMTNDVRNLEVLPSLYSLLLNSRGRVLYDIILYKLGCNEYLVEYDATAVEHLQKHLLMYRLRKDVNIKPLTDLKAWVIYKPFGQQMENDTSKVLIDQLNRIDGIVKAVKDPRIKDLGIRVITNKSIELPKVLPPGYSYGEDGSYKIFRYKLGVGEGVLDHPPGSCTPFDINVDLLNGVSFTKGCYIGQEMTARSQHVFVIRKRLVPVVLQKIDTYPIFPPECAIIDEKNQKLGRFRSHVGQYGLAFLKYEESEKSQVLKLKGFDLTLDVIRPKWWPLNLKKETSSVA